MSSGQLARTPANFPRMKHRAAHRHQRRQTATELGQAIRALVTMAAAMPAAFEAMAASINQSMWHLAAAIGEFPPPPPRPPWFQALDQAEARGARGGTGFL